MVFCLELFHWKTNIPTLEDEHHAWKELRRYERSLPCRDPVYDSPEYVQPFWSLFSAYRLTGFQSSS